MHSLNLLKGLISTVITGNGSVSMVNVSGYPRILVVEYGVLGTLLQHSIRKNLTRENWID